jgi:hypothetical protein
MSKISALIAAQGQDVTKMAKFIEKFGDNITYSRYGFFDTYCRSTFLRIALVDDYIVAAHEDSRYETDVGGIGSEITVVAYDLEVADTWNLGHLIHYRDQCYPEKDRQGPIPEKFMGCVKNADGTLTVTAIMPGDREVRYLLSPRVKKAG